jgi:hypothetical protein
MTDRDDDERELHSAFARLREEEARRAPMLAQLVARAREAEESARGARLLRLRFALPLAGAAMAALAWWITAGAPAPEPSQLAAERAQREALAARPPLIALGSLHSPTDALLELEVPAPPRGLSDSLIPGPPPTPAPHSSLGLDPARRNA